MRISYYETSWVQLWVTSFFQEVLLENELADSRKDKDPPLKTFPLKKEVELRFLHFKLVDFWGKGGGLQYFFVEPGEIVQLTIQALFDQSSGFRESESCRSFHFFDYFHFFHYFDIFEHTVNGSLNIFAVLGIEAAILTSLTI